MWRWSERLASRNHRRFEGRYEVVRYEDLVADPGGTLARVCRFLELTEPTPAAVPDGTPITTDSVGRHHRDISRAERRYIEVAARRGMERSGYARESQTDPVAARIAFWAGVVPVQTFHAAMWRPAMEIRQHRGRRPSDRRLASHEPRAEGPT
jgi:hypothetical protein